MQTISILVIMADSIGRQAGAEWVKKSPPKRTFLFSREAVKQVQADLRRRVAAKPNSAKPAKASDSGSGIELPRKLPVPDMSMI